MAPAPHPGDAFTGAPADRLQNPFRFHLDPMVRLLLIDLTGDLDRVYRGFEPQVFDDAVDGRGVIVLGWRRDGRVDVFHQPDVSQWERGEKRPRGPSLKLLTLVAKGGLRAIA
jgi:hypothetical protein